MATALMFPDPEKGGRGKNRNSELPFSKMHLSRARAVLTYTPDLAEPVKSGATSLTDAYQKALKCKRESESTEARFAKVQAADPKLAEERLTLEDAIKKLDARLAKEAERERNVHLTLFDSLADVVRGASLFQNPEAFAEKMYLIFAKEWEQERAQWPLLQKLNVGQLERALQGLQLLIEEFKDAQTGHQPDTQDTQVQLPDGAG